MSLMGQHIMCDGDVANYHVPKATVAAAVHDQTFDMISRVEHQGHFHKERGGWGNRHPKSKARQ